MHLTKAAIRTGKEEIPGGKTLDLTKKLKKDEIEALEEAGYIVPVVNEDNKDESCKNLEEILDATPASLKKAELVAALEHYKLPTEGNVKELREKLERMNELLERDTLEEIDTEEYAMLANYAGVEPTGDKEDDIAALEEALR
jgi:hypothetical protein